MGIYHHFDEGCVCSRCGFDGAEWHWWKHNTYEGRDSDAKEPECPNGLDATVYDDRDDADNYYPYEDEV